MALQVLGYKCTQAFHFIYLSIQYGIGFVFSANQISDHLGGAGYVSSVGDKCFASFLDRELEGRIINFVFFLLMAFNVLYACFLALRMK